MDLVVYGSFSCPYSYLASLRVDRLLAAGLAEVEWRAVVHDPDVPVEGCPVDGELADTLEAELEAVRRLLATGEPFPVSRPPVQPNTTAAVAGYCAASGHRRHSLRASLFEAYWVDGADIGDRAVLDRLGCAADGPNAPMRAWQAEWSADERAVVPTLLLPGGTVWRGKEALSRLGEMEAGGTGAADI